jgi:hypothetical protein
MQPDSPNGSTIVPDGRIAGVAILASAAVGLVAIAHHPTVGTARGAADVFGQIAALSAIDEVVHGVLIVLSGALLFGFAVFAQRRGLHRGSVLLGLIGYAVASGGIIGAALIDGFLVPALGSRYAGAPAQSMGTGLHLLGMAGTAIQILTKFAFVATAVAVLSWSAGLLRARGAVRATGFAGIVAAVVSVVTMVWAGQLNPHNLVVIVGVQSVWNVAIGVLLIRGDL